MKCTGSRKLIELLPFIRWLCSYIIENSCNLFFKTIDISKLKQSAKPQGYLKKNKKTHVEIARAHSVLRHVCRPLKAK